MAVKKDMDPQAVEYFTFDWKLWLEGKTISSATISIDDPKLAEASPATIGPDSVTVYLAPTGNAVEGETYTVTCHVKDSSAPAREDDALLKIKIKSKR